MYMLMFKLLSSSKLYALLITKTYELDKCINLLTWKINNLDKRMCSINFNNCACHTKKDPTTKTEKKLYFSSDAQPNEEQIQGTRLACISLSMPFLRSGLTVLFSTIIFPIRASRRSSYEKRQNRKVKIQRERSIHVEIDWRRRRRRRRRSK